MARDSFKIGKSLSLRPQTTAPTVDVTNGDLYYNDTDNAMRARINSEWIDIGGGSGTGSGEINYILNPDGADNLDQDQTDDVGDWVIDGGSALASTVTTVGSEIPREYLKTTAIKLAAVSNGTGTYVRHRFTMGDADKNKKLKIQWAQLVHANYANDDYKVALYTNSAADYTGTPIRVPLTGDNDGGNSFIKDITGQYLNTFSAGSADHYELRIIKAATGTTAIIYLNDVIVGPGVVATSPDSRWPSYDDSEVSFFSSIPGGWDLKQATFTPREDTEGNWTLEFLVLASVNVTSSVTVNLNGITVKPVSGGADYPITVFGDAAGSRGRVFDTADQILLEYSNDQTTFWCRGTIEITGKPTWANKIGPDMILGSIPSIVSPWTAFTPVFTSGGFTTSSSVGSFRRVGESMEVTMKVILSSAVSTFMRLEVPDNKTADTTKIELSAIVGQSFAIHSAGRSNGTVYLNSSTTLQISDENELNQDWDNNSPVTWISGDLFSLQYTIPIAEWAGSSQDTATVGISEATEDGLGLVVKDRYERRSHGTLTSASGAFTTYSNLTVGKVYEITFGGQLDQFSTVSANARVDFTFGGQQVRWGKTQSGTYVESPDNMGASWTVLVIADGTSFTMTATISGSNNIAFAYSYVKELNNIISTTFS